MESITLQQLQAVKYQLSLPFELGFEGQSIQCLQLLRIVPGKRMVFSGNLIHTDKHIEKVLIKLFIHPTRAKKHCSRELEGAQLLAEHHISTPELLAQGIAEDGIYCLLFRYLEGQNLAQFWAAQPSKQRIKKLQQLMPILAQHHEAGLAHQDLHYANFFLAGRIYTLDGEEVKASNKPLQKKARLKNLALFLAQTFDLRREANLSLLDDYLANSSIDLMPRERMQFLVMIRRFQQGRIKHYLRKILRDCTEVVFQKKKQAYSLCRREYHDTSMQQLLDDPEAFFQNEQSFFLKQGNTCTVKSVMVADKQYVIKRYNPKGITYELKHKWQMSRAKRSWINSHLLRFMGIPTPEPVALIETTPALGKRCSYFVCRFQAGQSSWGYFCDSEDEIPTDEKILMAKKIVSTLKLLMNYLISHGDLKGSNILIDDGNVFLLDLDGMTQHTLNWKFKKSWQRDKRRFLKNWDKKACYKKWQTYFNQTL